MEERRKEPRFPLRIPAHVLVGVDEVLYRGYVVNLSGSGALVTMSGGVVEDGRAATVQFVIDPNVECVASGRIAHTSVLEDGQAFGVGLYEHNEAYGRFTQELAVASKPETMAFVSRIVRIVIRVP